MFEESRMNEEKKPPLLCTLTGEAYQPARVYYDVNQKNAVLGRFKRLRCVDYHSEQNRWVWLYTEEAKNIKFAKSSYRDILKKYRPIILGYFTFESDTKLRLDVRSFERVIEAITFFDLKINRRLAKVKTVKIVNKLFPGTLAQEEMLNHHAIFFEQLKAVNPKEKMEELEELTAQYETKEEKQNAVWLYLEEKMKESFPEVEELETNFYDDGLGSIAISLRMRHNQVVEHWKGNKNFSQFDVMTNLLKNFEE